jgi:hypothetical protein
MILRDQKSKLEIYGVNSQKVILFLCMKIAHYVHSFMIK